MSRRNLLWTTSVTLISLICWHAATSAPQDDNYALFKVFVDTLDQVEREYVRELDQQSLFQGGLIGIMESLDVDSSYLAPEVYARSAADENKTAGIGLYVALRSAFARFGPYEAAAPRRLTVLGVLPGSPAERAGMLPGDVIAEIDQSNVGRLTLEESVHLLRGEPGSEVTVKVFRDLRGADFEGDPQAPPENGEPKETSQEPPGDADHTQVANDDGSLDITLKRAVVQLPHLTGKQMREDGAWDFTLSADDGIAYVHLPALSTGIAAQLSEVLNGFKPDDLRGLVLDLRFNAGGLIEQAVRVADLFLAQGRIATMTGPNVKSQHWDARAEGTRDHLPLVVLVNRYTAGPAEVLAACLQDHGRATVLGERTMGRTGVSRLIELRDGKSALKLTVATYVRTDGTSLYRHHSDGSKDPWGVRPDKGLNFDQDLRQLVKHFRLRAKPATEASARADAGFVDDVLAKAAEVLRKRPGEAAASL